MVEFGCGRGYNIYFWVISWLKKYNWFSKVQKYNNSEKLETDEQWYAFMQWKCQEKRKTKQGSIPLF